MERLVFDSRARRTVKNCPCGRSNRDGKFCPFKGFEDKGKCHSCGELFLPKSDTNGEAWRDSDQWQTTSPPSVSKQADYIDAATVNQTLQRYDENNFTQFLNQVFQNDPSVLADVVKRFSIGTAKEGKTVFWQRDTLGNYRSGQIIHYDPSTGKRDKTRFINWAHHVLKLTDFQLIQCFSGEHQLTTENKPIAIVEAAKTAAIMTPIEPRYTWLATNGANGLTVEKCKVLEGRNVVLYPDLGKFEQWQSEAKKIANQLKINIKISDLLEDYVSKLPETERNDHIKSGLDIADYALKFDWYGAVLKAKQPKTLPISNDERTLQNMIQKQPLVKDMISRFGLVNAKTMRPFQSV
jgi:hypothetical protein